MMDRTKFPRLLFKTFLFVMIISLVLVPLAGDSIGKVSLYNWLIPGRERLPFSDTPELAYNLSLFNLNAMFASHQISDEGCQREMYRVIILGDSSTWGTLLRPEETLAGQLNQLDLIASDGKAIHFYNLGYPTMSLAKDLLLLDKAQKFKPDMIVWFFTLESFPADKQLTSPLVENNPESVANAFEKYDLNPNTYGVDQLTISYWDRTLFKQRRNYADILRLQFYGVMWGITGIDQHYPKESKLAARDLTNNETFHSWQEGEMDASNLALEILSAGKLAAGSAPIIFINEPILISQGSNSDIRYNFYYPRWAYDSYREIVRQYTAEEEMFYLDLWNLVPEEEFTNTAIHTTPIGVRLLADELSPYVIAHISP